MKQKNWFWVAYAGALLVLFGLRTAELMVATEPTTGFLKLSFSFWGIVMAVALIGFFVLVIGYAARCLKKESPAEPGKISCVLSILLAGDFLFMTMSMNTEGLFTLPLKISLGVGAAAYLAYGLAGALERRLPRWVPLFFVPMWLFLLLTVFLDNNDIAAVPERIYSCLMLASCLLSSLYIARRTAGVLNNGSEKTLFGSCLISTGLCLICTFPRYVVALIGEKERLHPFAASEPLYAVWGLFALSFILECFILNKKEKSHAAEEPAAEETNL